MNINFKTRDAARKFHKARQDKSVYSKIVDNGKDCGKSRYSVELKGAGK